MKNEVIDLNDYKLKINMFKQQYQEIIDYERSLEDKGFSDVQKQCILKYYKEGYDMLQFVTSEFTEGQLDMIGTGLEIGADVSIYSDTRYDIYQMEDILIGLIKKIDVTIYANPEYSSDLMQTMLSGLEVGLDVSSYPETYPKYEYMGILYDTKDIEHIHDILRNRPRLSLLTEENKE